MTRGTWIVLSNDFCGELDRSFVPYIDGQEPDFNRALNLLIRDYSNWIITPGDIISFEEGESDVG